MERVSYDGESKRIYVHAIDYINNIVSEVIMDYKNVPFLNYPCIIHRHDDYVHVT